MNPALSHGWRCIAAATVVLCAAPAAAQPTSTLSTVVVTATRTPQQIAQALSDLRVIDAQTIARAGPVSLPELLQSAGGVEIASTGGPGQLSGVFLRGSNANHVVLLVDGVRVNSATAGTNAFESIPLAQIERIEILRGPASSLYGADAVGGVIQIFTKQAQRTDARVAAGSFGTREVSGGIGRRLGDATTLSLQAGLLESRAFSATNARLPAYHDPDTDPYRNKHLGLTLQHTLSAEHGLALRLLHSDGKVHYDDFGGGDAVTKQRLSTLALESRNRLTDGWQSLLRVARGADHRNDEAAFPFFFDTDQDQLTWQNDLRVPGGQLAAGIDWRREKVSSDTAFDRTARRNAAVFASYAAGFGAQLLQASLRRDDDSQFGAHDTGNLAWGLQITPAWRLSAGAGTAFKAPSFNDLYYPGFSNPALRPETSRNFELATRYDDGARRASLTLFDNRIRDLIQYDFASSSPQNLSRARIRGSTLGFGWRAGGWSAEAEWTSQDPVNASTGERLPRRAGRHATAALGWSGGPWRAGIDLVASSARVDNTFAPPAPRLAGYGLVHLHASRVIAPGWTASLRVRNAGDKTYELAQGYNTARRNTLFALEYAAL